MSSGQAIAVAMESVRNSLGMSQREAEKATGIPRDTVRRWVQGEREPSRRMVGIWLDAMAGVVRRRAPELDYMLDPLRIELGRTPATESDPTSLMILPSVPAAEDASSRYGVRMPDGRVAICERREMVPGHLHAARWRSAAGAAAGIYRVTPSGKTQVSLTQDDRPGDVLLVKTDQLDRCDPVIALVQHLLHETQG